MFGGPRTECTEYGSVHYREGLGALKPDTEVWRRGSMQNDEFELGYLTLAGHNRHANERLAKLVQFMTRRELRHLLGR